MSLVRELNGMFRMELRSEPIIDRRVPIAQASPQKKALVIGGSHALREGKELASRGYEVICCAVPGGKPNKTACEDMAEKVSEAVTQLSPEDIIVIHCFDNISFMARSEEGGDLPIRRYCDGEFHIEGGLVLASKERLYMYFQNCLPIFTLLEGRVVFFLTPMPRYLYMSCCQRTDHAPNRTGEDFEAVFRKSLMECRTHYKDFLFTSGCKNFKIINPGLCVPREDEDGNQLWGPDPVHPREEGYARIVDYFCGELVRLREKEDNKKRPGEPLAPPAKRRQTIQRPRWIEDVPSNVMVQGGFVQGRGGGRGGGRGAPARFFRAVRGARGSRGSRGYGGY
jgi:hypothetical protein